MEKIFEYGGYHFTPERGLPKRKKIFSLFHADSTLTKEWGFVNQVMFMRANILIPMKAFMLLRQIKNAICSAVWKMGNCIYLV